ncbi:hypothetical protein [Streptomyces sp. F-1]|uniref:hypothetical protein n=1 Tax=Streptomyces sp. F-1 TaxID=463642 RepID=UPI00085CA9D3|nr:hypothetical protein [Streptomyces sp. F-1]SFY51805.1 hypothetical protein STEPF1_05071 [Streptomyces sp. F-1]
MRPVVVVSITAALLVGLSGCSDHKEKREYTVPRALCGIPVDSEALTPFLPGGREVSVKQTMANMWGVSCQVRVDDRPAVLTSLWWTNQPNTAAYVGSQNNSKLDHRAEGGRFLYSGWEGFGETRNCTSKKLLGARLFTAFQMYSADHQDAGAMKRLVTEYTNAAEKTDTCTSGKPFPE